MLFRSERPVQALSARGVQYVEVRCMDIDPFNPLGIGLEAARFLDVFLHFLALESSCLTSDEEGVENRANFLATVKEGRRPGLKLQFKGESLLLTDWGQQLLDRMEPVADLLDRHLGGTQHRDSLAVQRAKLADPDSTPSARVLREIREAGNSFPAYTLANSQRQAAELIARPLSSSKTADFVAIAQASLDAQRDIERTQVGDFDTFVAAYRASTLGNIAI